MKETKKPPRESVQMELFETSGSGSRWAAAERYANYCSDRARLEEEVRVRTTPA